MEPTFTDYEMADGSTVKLCLTYGVVVKLRNKNKWLYKEYNRASFDFKDEPEYYQAIVLYAAYSGAFLMGGKDDDPELSFDEFLDSMNQDRLYNSNIYQEIYSPNAKKASGKLS